MWKIVSIRRSYYETEEILVWLKNGPADLLDLLPLLGTAAATCHDFKG